MSVAPILTRALRYGAILAIAVAVLGGTIGLLVFGMPGLWGGVLGAALAALFMGVTAASILLAARLTTGDPGSPLFFGVVLGAWVLKLVAFLIAAIWLRTQDWLDPYVFFGSVIVAVLGSLVVDVLAFQRSRVPYVSDVVLPGEGNDERP
jgi:hypothetical protein